MPVIDIDQILTVQFFYLVGLVSTLIALYTAGSAVSRHVLALRPPLLFDVTVIGIRAALFALAWLIGDLLFASDAMWLAITQQFLWVFLGVGLAAHAVNRLPWPAGIKRTLRVVTGIGGYGGFWLVASLEPYDASLAWWLNAVVISSLVLVVLPVIWQQRLAVRSHLVIIKRARFGFLFALLLHALAPVWYWIAIAGVLTAGFFGISLGPSGAAFVGLAMVRTAAFLGVAILLSRLTEWLANRGVRLPAPACDRYPALEHRVSAWGPLMLRGIHLVIMALLVAVLLEVWWALDLISLLTSPTGVAVIGQILSVLFILLLTALAWLLIMSWIEDRLNPEIGQGAPGAREKTLLTLFRNAAGIAIVIMAGMMLLAEFGVNIGPLIAGAGVIGLAVGFGAQKLVQDVITGIFIQIEDAIHTDDYITAAGISGTVERLSIRSLALRDLTGTLHIIPFSSVDLVSNFTRDFGYHLGVYGVAYRENIGEVIDQLQVAYDRLMDQGNISYAVSGPLEVDGVTALDNSSVNIRVRIRTTPGMQWAVGRAFNRVVKETFDEAGIEIPFPHMTLWFGEDKQGQAPAAPLRLLKEE